MKKESIKRKRKKKAAPRLKRGNGKTDDLPPIEPIGTAKERANSLSKTKTGGSKKNRSAEIEDYMTQATNGLAIEYDYDAEYDQNFHPQKVIESMSDGASWEELPIELGVLRFVIIQWMGEHAEFKDAMVEGAYLALAWWKKQGRKNIFNPYFNNSLYINQMANRFLENKVKVVAENLIDDGYEKVQMDEVEDVSMLSDAELEKRHNEGGKGGNKATKRKGKN